MSITPAARISATVVAVSAVAAPPTSAARLSSAVVRSGWLSSVRFGLGSVLAFRVAAEAFVLLGLYGSSAVRVILADPGAMARPWAQWDAQWQLAIAQSGFRAWKEIPQGTHVLSSAAFQPLLPGVMHVAALATGTSVLVAGLIVVSVALALAAVGLHRLVAVDYGAGAARLSVLLLLVFPTAIFLGAPYAEPVVLAEVVWAFVAVRSGRPLLAGVLVGLATVTKLYSIVFAVPLAVEALAMTAPAARARVAVLARVAVGPALGAAGLAVFYWMVFGDPLRFLRAQQDWVGRHFAAPWVALGNAVNPLPTLGINDAAGVLDLICVAVVAVAAVYAWRRLRRSYAVLLAVQLAVFTSTTSLVGTSRWTLDAFPLFIAGGVLAARHRGLRILLVAVSLPAAGLFAWTYSHGGWAG
ncbi:MAG: hypothetical protein ABI352_08240 [Candidatus Dormibacter sp.]